MNTSLNYLFNNKFQFGEAHLRNRILSHPDVGRRWYPKLYEKYSKQILQ